MTGAQHGGGPDGVESGDAGGLGGGNEGGAAAPSFGAYVRLLRRNRQFALAFAGEAVSQAGNWFAYVAVLQLVSRLDARASAVSVVVVCKRLPATLLAPFMGSLADGFDKRQGLTACSVVAGVASVLMCAVRARAALPALYVLLALQAAAVAQYDPFRRSLIPLLVPAKDLQKAATMDGLMWSSMLAVGAALGGVAVAALGTTTCLLLDALSFGASACLWAALAPTHDAEAAAKAAAAAAAPAGAGDADAGSARLSVAQRFAAMTRELGAYLRADAHAGVYCALKASGAVAWGALDVLNVRYAALPQMQQLGGEAVTMGLFFASMGVGCVLGPVTADVLTPQRERPLLRACVASLAAISASYGVLAAALGAGRGGFALVLLATFLNSCGRSTLWIYSTLLLQLRGAQPMLGRLFSLEQALQTLCAAASGVAAGAAADAGASHAAICSAFVVGAALVTAGYGAYFARRFAAVAPRDSSECEAAAAGDAPHAASVAGEELQPLVAADAGTRSAAA